MLPINLVRENSDVIEQGIAAKREKADIGQILKLDKEQRSLLNELNEKRAKRNNASEKIGKAKAQGQVADDAIKEMQILSKNIKNVEKNLAEINERLEPLLYQIPNLPHKTVPAGSDPEDNVLVREWGEKPQSTFKYKDHLKLGEKLNIFDLKRGAVIAGSGFPLYIGQGAKLERSLINFMLDFHVTNYSCKEIFPPFVARMEAMRNTAQIPKMQDDMYLVERDDIYLIPTAEVPLTNIHQNEIIDEKILPINYVAYSACFRREAGSYGKETRGLSRLHQFNKVEIVKFVKPENSYNELEALTLQAEAILQLLGLHYRVLALCAGDLSFASAKSYDLEVWAPGEERWLEVSTCSNYESFQARRGKIRYRREEDKKVDFVHTLNGSGLATPRLMIALLETFQMPDGSISLPEPLHSYFGAEVIKR
ncbi:MAG: serine--tRNA ligase [Candidatus Neomarinimicrobiota bacterium]